MANFSFIKTQISIKKTKDISNLNEKTISE